MKSSSYVSLEIWAMFGETSPDRASIRFDNEFLQLRFYFCSGILL